MIVRRRFVRGLQEIVLCAWRLLYLQAVLCCVPLNVQDASPEYQGEFHLEDRGRGGWVTPLQGVGA